MHFFLAPSVQTRKLALMVRFVRLSLLFLTLSCSVSGPVFQPEAESPFYLPGVGQGVGVSTWFFDVGNGGWHDLRLGELVLMRKSPLRARATFELRILARNRIGSIRMKSIEGFVRPSENGLRLYAERCRLYGKKDYVDRFVPLDGWSCDHLLFRLRLTPEGNLEKDPQKTEQTEDADWLYLRRFSPLSSHPALGGRPVWAGQRLAAPDAASADLPVDAPAAKYGDETHPGGVLTSDDGAVYFGYDAGRHLRPGDNILLFADQTGSPPKPGRVLHVVGDFVLVQNAAQKAPVAGIMSTRVPKGLFD